jgi:hypothetical protein
MDALGFDVTKVAGTYATFAGLLAGFVFAAMVYLIGSAAQRNRHAETHILDVPLSWSVLAFVSLSVASFLFSELSGEDRFALPAIDGPALPTRVRPLVLFVVASGTLTTAILMLLLALIWLFNREHPIGGLTGQLRFTTYLAGLLTCYFLIGAFLAAPIVQGQIAVDDESTVLPTFAIFAVSVVLGELFGALLRRLGASVISVVRLASQYLLLATVFACGALFYLLENANEAGSKTWHVPQYEWWGVGAFGVVLLLCIANLPPWRSSKGTVD